MKFFDKLKELIKKILKEKNNKELKFLPEKVIIQQLSTCESKEFTNIELSEGELVSFTDEILDTTSKVSEEKFKHNLKILIEQAKKKGKVDKFMLIREDNFFPDNWEWKVLSKNTRLERTNTCISEEIRRAIAFEQSGFSPYIEMGNIRVPNPALEDKTMQALSQLDKTIGTVLLPSKFRSTKHFTINTPLAVTGYYNSVETDRDFIIIDDMSTFLNSEYGYSASYHDAYLDVSHEELPISESAVVLINEESYERIINDKKIANQLAQRRVVRYKGDEVIAINMILTEMGALPSVVGSRYAEYDPEIFSILDDSIKTLTEENSLFFNKSHAGQLKPDGGHFSNYYDDQNNDYEIAVGEFVNFINQKLSEQPELFTERLTITQSNAAQIVERVGANRLLEIINEYNELANDRLNRAFETRAQDKKNITPEVHKQFVETISLINGFYKTIPEYESDNAKYQTEETIRKFMQANTVSEQLELAQHIKELICKKELDKYETVTGDKTITMKQIVSNAINKGISTEHVIKSDTVVHSVTQGQQRKGENTK